LFLLIDAQMVMSAGNTQSEEQISSAFCFCARASAHKLSPTCTVFSSSCSAGEECATRDFTAAATHSRRQEHLITHGAGDGGAEGISASGVVSVEAFSCGSSGAEIDPNPSYSEGSTVLSCVRSTDAKFHVVDIDTFTYESPSGTIIQNAVLSGGVEAARTVKDCTLVIGESQMATLLVDAF
jgi:hypothetical protein